VDIVLEQKLIDLLNRTLNQSPIVKNTKNGRQFIYYSPFISHRKRKLEVNFPTMKWHCWISNKGGFSIKSLIFKINPPECILRELQSLLKDEPIKFHSEFSKTEVILKLPDEYIPLIKKSNTIEYKHAINYCKKRGLSILDIFRYKIGYCIEGKYKNRIIIPSYDSNFNIKFFVGRSWYSNSTLPYLNSPFSKNIIGFESLINWKYPIVLVEGSFDAISVKINAIPLFGKVLSENLILKIIDEGVKEIHVCLDNDALSSNLRICEKFLKYGIKVKFINLLEKDPSAIGYKKITEIIQNTDYIDEFSLLKFKIKYGIK